MSTSRVVLADYAQAWKDGYRGTLDEFKKKKEKKETKKSVTQENINKATSSGRITSTTTIEKPVTKTSSVSLDTNTGVSTGSIVQGGHSYNVDKDGNVFKNNKFVPAESYPYIPTSVLNMASSIKDSWGSEETKITGGLSNLFVLAGGFLLFRWVFK